MFAIVRLGNQQVKVQAGDFIRSPFLKEAKETIDLPVLALGSKSGLLLDASDLAKAKVKAKVLREGLAKKVIVFKKKRRKGYRRTKGHRQKFTEVQILEISFGSETSKASKEVASKTTSVKKATAVKAKTSSAKKPAVKKAAATKVKASSTKKPAVKKATTTKSKTTKKPTSKSK